MPTEPLRCEEIEARLVECLLARREAGAGDRAHAATCPTCGATLRELLALGGALAASAEPEPPAELVAHTWQQAVAVLGTPVGGAARHTLPVGFGRECLRLMGGALVPFPLVVAWNVAILALGAQLLSGILPSGLLLGLATAYAVTAAGWLGLVYATIPFVAHRRVLQRLGENPG